MRACFKLEKYCTLVLSPPINIFREQIIGSTFWSKSPSILQTLLGVRFKATSTPTIKQEQWLIGVKHD